MHPLIGNSTLKKEAGLHYCRSAHRALACLSSEQTTLKPTPICIYVCQPLQKRLSDIVTYHGRKMLQCFGRYNEFARFDVPKQSVITNAFMSLPTHHYKRNIPKAWARLIVRYQPMLKGRLTSLQHGIILKIAAKILLFFQLSK